MPALTWTPVGESPLDLNDGTNYALRALEDGGLGPVVHETVKTPSRRGETYVRSVLEPRLLVLQVDVLAADFTTLQTRRRDLLKALNPDKGVGTLKWTPAGASPVYAIDAIVEEGLGFTRNRGPKLEQVALSLRCPDPTWYDPVSNVPSAATTGGISIPMSFPMSIIGLESTLAVSNLGDVETFPVIKVKRAAGSFAGPKITNQTSGKVFHLTSGLIVAANDELVIDLLKQTAKVGSTSVMQYRTAASEAWGLVRGQNSIKFEVSSGSGTTFTLEFFTRYIGV